MHFVCNAGDIVEASKSVVISQSNGLYPDCVITAAFITQDITLD